MLGLQDPGHAGGGDHDARALRVARPVGDAGVHDGDRGVGGRPLLREEQRERAAERGAAPEDAHLVARHLDLVEREQRLDAGGRAGRGSRHHEREATHVDGVHAVDVLVGVHLEQRGVVVELRRHRVLHEERVDVIGVVEAADGSDEIGLASRPPGGGCAVTPIPSPVHAASSCPT